MLRYLFRLLLISLLAAKSNAQEAATDSSINLINTAVNFYYQSLGELSPLYNGSEYLSYTHTLQSGHPFFNSTQFEKGTIHLDGMIFRNVMMLYDIIKDKVIILHFDNIHKVDLPVYRIGEFTFLGHHFIRLYPDSMNIMEEGFYERLYNGKTSLFIQRKKVIREERTGTEINNVVDEANGFYVQKNGYHAVKNMRVLLQILNDKREQVRQFLKKNKIKFKKEPERAMVMAVQYYDRLSK
jgi:hypothetical protein